MALEYIATAHRRVDAALRAADGPDGISMLPPAAVDELVDLKLFLMGLALAADPKAKTPVNLKLVRRQGRPKKNIIQTNAYRKAARELNRRKSRGYDAAVIEIASETGLDRSEIQAWASHLERTDAVIAVGKIAAFFRSAI
jgi:hypothetical protein